MLKRASMLQGFCGQGHRRIDIHGAPKTATVCRQADHAAAGV